MGVAQEGCIATQAGKCKCATSGGPGLLAPMQHTWDAIFSAASDEERQAARCALLAKETKLLQTIDRLRLAAAPIARADRAARELAIMSAPKRWQLADGGVMEVATPGTLQAGELAAAYHTLVATGGGELDARLAALLAVKHHAKALDCNLSREIVGLVDREADLLNRCGLFSTWEGRMI